VQKNGWHPIVSFPSILDSLALVLSSFTRTVYFSYGWATLLGEPLGNVPYQYLAHTSGPFRSKIKAPPSNLYWSTEWWSGEHRPDILKEQTRIGDRPRWIKFTIVRDARTVWSGMRVNVFFSPYCCKFYCPLLMVLYLIYDL
jgi:hypothetical protein